MPYFAQYSGSTCDAYSGPVSDGYGNTGRVINAPVERRVEDAWLDHLTLPGGWYATVQARPKPEPFHTRYGDTVTAVSVSRGRAFEPRGGYDVGYLTGDQVIVRAHRDADPTKPDEIYVFRRYDGGAWRFPSPGMTVEQYQSWDGRWDQTSAGHLNDLDLAAWLDTAPPTPLHDPEAILYDPPTTTS